MLRAAGRLGAVSARSHAWAASRTRSNPVAKSSSGDCASRLNSGPQQAALSPDASATTFHRRQLPASCIAFSSSEGRAIFQEALQEGHLEGSYFDLAEQFVTQSDPHFCGLTTLAMALNALNVDPRRVWKGPWRWYTEELLDCCLPTESVKARGGIHFHEFHGYAACQPLNVVAVQAGTPAFSEDRFRNTLKLVTSSKNRVRSRLNSVLVCAYARAALDQTGDGHYSPIAAFNERRDLALVMDVARFKYPPHWVQVSRLFQAMQPHDLATGEPRGYFLLSASQDQPCPLRTPPRDTFHKESFLEARLREKEIGVSSDVGLGGPGRRVRSGKAGTSGDCAGGSDKASSS